MPDILQVELCFFPERVHRDCGAIAMDPTSGRDPK